MDCFTNFFLELRFISGVYGKHRVEQADVVREKAIQIFGRGNKDSFFGVNAQNGFMRFKFFLGQMVNALFKSFQIAA